MQARSSLLSACSGQACSSIRVEAARRVSAGQAGACLRCQLAPSTSPSCRIQARSGLISLLGSLHIVHAPSSSLRRSQTGMHVTGVAPGSHDVLHIPISMPCTLIDRSSSLDAAPGCVVERGLCGLLHRVDMQDTSQALQNLASMPSATLLQRLRAQGEALFPFLVAYGLQPHLDISSCQIC